MEVGSCGNKCYDRTSKTVHLVHNAKTLSVFNKFSVHIALHQLTDDGSGLPVKEENSDFQASSCRTL